MSAAPDARCLNVPCVDCDAAPGAPCMGRGKPMRWFHNARKAALRSAPQAGPVHVEQAPSLLEPSLARWAQSPRDYQERAIARGVLAVERREHILLSSPTGTGKGTMELGLLRTLHSAGKRALIVTPSLEVVRGYLERCGATSEQLAGSAESLARLGELIHVTTPVRLRNRLRDGRATAPDVLIVDEAHHATVDNVQGGGLAEFAPRAIRVGFTATAFRGSPSETQDLRDAWGEPFVVLTIPQAVENGSWALPRWKVVPLVDDDTLGVKNGDLDADEVVLQAAGPLATLVASLDLAIPTCVTVPSVDAAKSLAELLTGLNVESRVVLGETPASERAAAYDRVKAGGACLVSVKVLGEGVDLPWLDRWVDASPTLSPVAFLQKLGRITRPGRPKFYVGTNRNLERHGYLLQGALPREVVREAQEAFGGASVRGGRAGLIKALAKLKPIQLPLAGGVTGTMWALTNVDEQTGVVFERCILLDPTSEAVVSAERAIPRPGEFKNANWKACAIPDKIEGFKAQRTGNKGVSVNMLKWWRRDAARVGLDASVEPNQAQFFALPVLTDLKASMDPTPPKGTRKPEGTTTSTLDSAKSTSNGARSAPASPAQESSVASVPSAPQTTPGEVMTGYFTVVREDGTRTTFRVRKPQPADASFAPGKQVLEYLRGADNTKDYERIGFVDSNGVRVWRRFEKIEERVKQDWAAIVGNEEAAGKTYALHSKNCYRCGRLLTTPESITSGIGPVCEEMI